MKGETDLVQIRENLRGTARAFVDSFRSARLARVQVAFIAFNLMEWAAYIAIDVYAFGQGGIRAVGYVALLQLIPAALIAPWVRSWATVIRVTGCSWRPTPRSLS